MLACKCQFSGYTQLKKCKKYFHNKLHLYNIILVRERASPKSYHRTLLRTLLAYKTP